MEWYTPYMAFFLLKEKSRDAMPRRSRKTV
jgi:hypothetical protein